MRKETNDCFPRFLLIRQKNKFYLTVFRKDTNIDLYIKWLYINRALLARLFFLTNSLQIATLFLMQFRFI